MQLLLSLVMELHGVEIDTQLLLEYKDILQVTKEMKIVILLTP